jgi:hypothetical protein
MDREGKPQWSMTVTVWHGPTFGHVVDLQTVSRSRMEDLDICIGTWRGVGVPEDVYKGILATVDSVLGDHLVYRYSIQPRLDWSLGGEQEPF